MSCSKTQYSGPVQGLNWDCSIRKSVHYLLGYCTSPPWQVTGYYCLYFKPFYSVTLSQRDTPHLYILCVPMWLDKRSVQRQTFFWFVQEHSKMLLCVASKTHKVSRVLLNACLHIYNCFINALSKISASHRFQNISLYVTEQEGCTGENWLKDVSVQTKQWDPYIVHPRANIPQ